MNNLRLSSFTVKNYRSLKNVTLNFPENEPLVICGENNIGKTNFLRALNLFFNHQHDEDTFLSSRDIPHHIFEGSRGGNAKCTLQATISSRGKSNLLKVIFDKADGVISYSKDGKKITDEAFFGEIKNIKYVLIESHNVDLPSIIAKTLKKDGLLSLDKQRSKQKKPLEKLKEFIALSEQALEDIEKDINKCFAEFADFEGILKDKEIRIQFAQFDKLRDVVKDMTEITLYDGNNHNIASKGSGAQRALFLSLMKYISMNTKENIIWGVDEPEAFLQPKLQKRVAAVLNDLASKHHSIILTTHSPSFINLSSLKNTHLFKGELQPKEYKRRPGQQYFEMDTKPLAFESSAKKINAIKEHLGISNNDGWSIMPQNIVVEGEDDQKYFQALYTALDCPTPNIIWTGGASKAGGYLQYYNSEANELEYRPSFTCIFDNDNEGRKQALKINPTHFRNIEISKKALPRFDGATRAYSDRKGHDWAVEDFLPPNIMFDAINKLFRKEKYKIITASQRTAWKTGPAFRAKQILDYAKDKCIENNPNKPPLEMNTPGRKKQLCKFGCELIEKTENPHDFFEIQKTFLMELLKD